MTRLGLVTLGPAAFCLFVSAFAAGLEKKPAEASAEQIERWVGDLDSPRFAVREAATRRLHEVGNAGISPMVAAAGSGSVEVARRTVAVLHQLVRSTNAVTRQSAEQGLETLAASSRRIVADRAKATLRVYRLQQQRASLSEIERLGGKVMMVGLMGDEYVVQMIILGKGWQGGEQGLKHLRMLTGLNHLGIRGAEITDQGIEHIHGLKRLQTLQLYHTGVTDEGEKALREALPSTRIDRRQGALLGVVCSTVDKACRIEVVQPRSAADIGGLQVGDVITQIQGEAVTTFQELVANLARRKPGARLTIEYTRGQNPATTEVVLGEIELSGDE